jgi:hypothetical protein
LSGVGIAATAFANILKDRPVRPVGSHSLVPAHSPVGCPSRSVPAFAHQDCSTGHYRALHPLSGEIFGFERFQDAVRNSGALSADLLLEEIAAQVAPLVKGAPQHDDLTVIVVAVDKNAGEKQEEHPETEKGKSGKVQT